MSDPRERHSGADVHTGSGLTMLKKEPRWKVLNQIYSDPDVTAFK